MYASGVRLASRGLRTSVLYFPYQVRHFFCFARGVMNVSGARLASRDFRTSVLYFELQVRDFLSCKNSVVSLWRPVVSTSMVYFKVAGARLSALQGA